jgi:hypothetical protein
MKELILQSKGDEPLTIFEHLPPPVTITGGSLIVQVDKKFNHTVQNGRHHYEYPDAFKIAGVLILTRGFEVRFKNFLLQKPIIQVWLQAPPQGTPSIDIGNVSGPQTFLMDVDGDLGTPTAAPDPTVHPGETIHSYSHPGFPDPAGNIPPFTIERVRVSDLIDGTSSPVFDALRTTDQTEPDLGFRIMIFDPHSAGLT